MSKDRDKVAGRPRPLLIIGVGVVVVGVFVIILALVISNSNNTGAPSVITAQSYAAEVEEALTGADPDIGAGLINDHECFACHVLGDGSLSPLFDGIGLFASDRRLPLPAAAYLYEATVFPGAFVVDNYSDSMPNTYAESLTTQEIGHIIAYLLTLTDPPYEG